MDEEGHSLDLITADAVKFIKTKRANREIAGYEPMLRFVKTLVSDQRAEHNAAWLTYGPKIAGMHKGKRDHMEIHVIG